MMASQEAQAKAYKEMTKTNKMRDDDALFHSIEIYDGSPPSLRNGLIVLIRVLALQVET